MTRATLELASLFQNSTPHRWEDVWPLRLTSRETDSINGGSSVEKGFEPGTFWLRGRNLTTRPTRLRTALIDRFQQTLDFRKRISETNKNMSLNAMMSVERPWRNWECPLSSFVGFLEADLNGAVFYEASRY
ncbi:hypothetical protein AVEN_5533-1 [Araneus ventricosus]|uniref:Uncharacterized protein n=1 Tax=Araneus ventricosus TaxID=182803 RepID=A0A4Y2DUA4_ARAVE|nr:hypothetical protein AVEN_5533-1 [Araneus ventricosus]